MPVPVPIVANTKALKATFFMSDGKYTWAENYWGVGDTDIAKFLGRANLLAAQRIRLLGLGVSLFLIRASDEAVQRDSLVYETGDPGFLGGYNAGGKNAAVTAAEVPYSCVLVRGEGVEPVTGKLGLYRKSLYMSGWPQQDITDPAGPTLGPVTQQAFAAFRTYCLNNNWGFLAFKRDLDGFGPFKVISAQIGAGGASLAAIAIDPGKANPTIAVGDVIQLSSFKGSNGDQGLSNNLSFNGTYRVVNVLANVITIQLPFTFVSYNSNPPFGKLTKRERWVVSYSDLSVRGETHRKRGGRVFLPLGKSKTKR